MLSLPRKPDSETPLLVRSTDQISDSQPTSSEVADAAKAFSQLKSKPKTGLWNIAAKPAAPLQQKDLPRANDLPQPKEQRQQPKELQRQQPKQSSSVESAVPSITVTEHTFDTNANAEERKDTVNSGIGKPQSSIHFSDVVMSTLPSQVRIMETRPANFWRMKIRGLGTVVLEY